jgi:hypothetical protein
MNDLFCDRVLSGLYNWLQAQPNRLDPVWTPPSPADVLLDEIEGHVTILKSLSFPDNTFIQGMKARGFIGNYREGFYWIHIDDAFERLMAAQREKWGPPHDELVLHKMETSIFREGYGPEGMRVLMKQHPPPPDELVKLEGNREWIVMASVSGVRTLVPCTEQEAVMGWEMKVRGLYRPAESLVFFIPGTEDICLVGKEDEECSEFVQELLVRSHPTAQLIDIPTHLDPLEEGEDDWVGPLF